jgi:hypothetical protein
MKMLALPTETELGEGEDDASLKAEWWWVCDGMEKDSLLGEVEAVDEEERKDMEESSRLRRMEA